MSTQVQWKRGTTAQNNTYTGAIAEITVDTTLKQLRLHDGTTPGGVTIAGTAVAVNSATNLVAGTAGQIPYQTAPNATSFFGPGTAGNVLVSYGASGTPTFQNTLTLTGTTAASSTTTGALVVGGGVGIGGNLYVGGDIIANKLTIQLTTVTTTLVQTDDIISTYNTTPTTSTNTGALLIGGGAGIAGGLYVGGVITATNVFVNGYAVSTASALTIQSSGSSLGTAGTLNFGTGTIATVSTTSIAAIWVNTATLMTSSVNLDGGATGSIPYQSTSGSTTFLGIGTNGYILTSSGSAPQWTALTGLSAGQATTATNLANGTAGQVPYQTAPGATSFISTATTGNFLQANYVGAPTWTGTASMYVQDATVSTNIRAGTAGQLPYQSNTGTTSFIGTATTGNFLQSNFAGAPTWTTTANIYVANASIATNLRAGAAGQIPYQSGANTTLFAAAGTYGQILMSQGTSAPLFQSTLSYAAGVLTSAVTTKITAAVTSTSTNTGAVQVVNGGIGVADSVYVGNRVGFGAGGISKVYQYYNPLTNSLDTVFG